MDLTNVESLFNLVKNQSEAYRRDDHDFDGKGFWHPIKGILDQTGWSAEKWKTVPSSMFTDTMSLAEYIINGYGEKQIIEENHFLIQTVRIPHNETPSLKKIIQVALNIGQYQGYSGRIISKNKITDYILKKDGDVLLDEILTDNLITDLSNILEKG